MNHHGFTYSSTLIIILAGTYGVVLGTSAVGGNKPVILLNTYSTYIPFHIWKDTTSHLYKDSRESKARIKQQFRLRQNPQSIHQINQRRSHDKFHSQN